MRKPRKPAAGPNPGSAAAPDAHLPDPYVVRYGRWARNPYLGLPAAFAFGLMAQVANMPTWLFLAWDLMVATVAGFCVFVHDTRFYPDRTVMVGICFLAVLPVWVRRYPRSALLQLEFEPADDSDASGFFWLILRSGRRLRIQHYNAGADNRPLLDQLMRDLPRITGLNVAGQATGRTQR